MRYKLRAFLFIAALCAAIFMPPWTLLLIIGITALRYPAWEAMFAGLFADLIWLPAYPLAFPFFTTASMLFVWGFEPLRRELMVGRVGLL